MDSKLFYSKLSTVPGPIRQWLGSDTVVDIVQAMDHQFNLPDGSSGVISKIIQKLQIKDLGPEYFSGELALELNIDKNKAILIAGEIKKVVFTPIKNEFVAYGIDISLLDKFEMPISRPVTMEAIPQPLEQKGWSKIPPAQILSQAPPRAPQASAVPISPTPKPPQQLGEFGRLATKMPAQAPVAPAGKANTSPPAPFMIRNDAMVRPIQNAPSFRGPTSTENIMRTPKIPMPMPQRPAIVELGQSTGPRVIHYSDLKSPLPTPMPLSKPPVATAGRQVSEITAIPVPKPASALTSIPKPPTASVPKPPAPQNVAPKIIVQNFK